MTDELTVNQLDPVPDLSPNTQQLQQHRGPRDGCGRWLRWSLMAGISRGARRTNDDGAMLGRPIHPAIPKLSLWRPQAKAQEQELGQALPSELLGRLRGSCPSSCSGSLY